MTTDQHLRRSVNPFATRFIRPGCVAPLDAAGRPLAVAELASRARSARVTALVGPHGSGKSNLLAAIAVELERRGPILRLRAPAARDVPGVVRAILRHAPGAVVCIDGWERIGLAGRCLIRGAARWRRSNLLVTAHRPAGLPVLVACTTTPALFERVVAALPPHDGRIAAQDLSDAFVRHAGNVREALLELYDRFEERVMDEPDAVRP